MSEFVGIFADVTNHRQGLCAVEIQYVVRERVHSVGATMASQPSDEDNIQMWKIKRVRVLNLHHCHVACDVLRSW
jgi:hypothetical protein